MSEQILAHTHQVHKHQTHNHAASGWRIHCGVEVTELSTNKQHTLSEHPEHVWTCSEACSGLCSEVFKGVQRRCVHRCSEVFIGVKTCSEVFIDF